MPSGPAGEDKRPRPQFGELAPEGWSWTPPAAAVPAEPEADAPSKPAAPLASSTLGAKKPPVAPSGLDAPQKPIRLGDVLATSVLIMLGLVLTASGVQEFFQLQDMLGLAYTQLGLGTYSGGTAAQTAGAIAAVLQIVIMLVVIGISVQLISKRRLSFYVPLAGGALALIVMVICMMVALSADPTFLAHVQSMSGQ